MRLTKLDMARVIVGQLYNMPHLPFADHWHVVKLTRRSTAALRPAYDMAMDAAVAQLRAEKGEDYHTECDGCLKRMIRCRQWRQPPGGANHDCKEV